MAAADYFIKFDGINGESVDAKHKNEIDVESWSWGETHAAAGPSGSGAGAGKVSMQDFQFVMGLNRASIGLMQACATGQHIQDRNALRHQGWQGPAGIPDIQISRRARQLVPDGRIRGRRRPDRFGVIQLRQDRGRVQAAEARRLLGDGRPIQVRPKGEQDLLARR